MTKVVTFCSSFNQSQPFSVISTAELCVDWLNNEEKALNPAKRKMKQIEVVKSMSGIGSLTYGVEIKLITAAHRLFLLL